MIQQDCVDILVYGEGEFPLFEIINKFDNLKEIKSIEGCLILRDGGIVDGGNAPVVNNLDALPIPDYLDFRDDINSRMYREPRQLDIFDSRSCPMRCHFCSEWQFWKKFRCKFSHKNQNITRDKHICVGCRHLGLINIDILSYYSFFTCPVQE